MRAARFYAYGGPEVLQVVEVPEPEPGPGQIRLQVQAAGVNATDGKVRSGQLGDDGLPQGTGRDVAGTVDALGDGVEGVAVGDAVFGLADHGDGIAELTLVTHFAPLPDGLDVVQAATLPVVVETATRSIDLLGVGPGVTLLVNGASGLIGGMATQLAVARGARVIGTASEGKQELVRSYGAEPVVYGEGVVDRVRAVASDGVDLALDIAGVGLADLVELAGGPENVVTIADWRGAQELGVRFARGEQGRAYDALDTIGELIAAGTVRVPQAQTFALEDVVDAHRALEDGSPEGKPVVVID